MLGFVVVAALAGPVTHGWKSGSRADAAAAARPVPNFKTAIAAIVDSGNTLAAAKASRWPVTSSP